MNRKTFWFVGLVFVSLAMLALGIMQVQAQAYTPGQIVKFDDNLDLVDSVITESANGNIGIGWTAPPQKFRIDNPLDQAGLYVTNTNTNSLANGMEVYSTGLAEQNTFAAGGRIQGGDPYIRGLVVKTGGNIGVGTDSPASKLHVVGRVLATGYDMPSDIRLKEDVTPLTGVLEKLDKIRGVSFKWNAQSEALGQSKGHQDVGVIAQEVQAVFPEVVTARGPENYQAVDYSKLTAVLIEAVKELKAENEVLKHRIQVLENK